MDRRCTKCGGPKTGASKTSSWCLVCLAALCRQTRERNRQRATELYANAKDNPCKDCGQRFPTVAMDFDHPAGLKKHNPADLMGRGRRWEVIEAEIAKCDLVCANCHRVRTYSRTHRWVYRSTELADVIAEHKSKPCVDCGRVLPPECMDFDHRDPATKLCSVTRFRTRSRRFLEQLLAEIAKCDLVCHCCHRLRTARRAEWQSFAHLPIS
jgi:hypothetical protein